MAESNKARLEAFCDGVFAIALTLLIIEIKIPEADGIKNSADLWKALYHLIPSLLAFLLSFIIVLISWVNHHAIFKSIHRTTAPFIFANGLLLLGVVVLPFPTALIAEFGYSSAAVPAVVVYCLVNIVQNLGWIIMGYSAIYPRPLTKSDAGTAIVKDMMKKGMMAFVIYLSCTVLAFWFPMTVAVVLACIWLAWLVFGITIKEVEL